MSTAEDYNLSISDEVASIYDDPDLLTAKETMTNSQEISNDPLKNAEPEKIPCKITVHDRPTAEPLPDLDENGWIKLTYDDVYDPAPIRIDDQYRQSFFWIDDSRFIYLDQISVRCINISTNENRILMSLCDFNDIKNTEFFGYGSEKFLQVGVNGKDSGMNAYNEGIFFNEEKSILYIPTYITHEDNTYSYLFHAFSCDDLSYLGERSGIDINSNSIPKETLIFNYREYQSTLRGDMIISRGENEKGNYSELFSIDEKVVPSIRSLFKDKDRIVAFGLKEGDEYQSLYKHCESPSGDYFMFINCTKSGIPNGFDFYWAREADIPLWFEVYDRSGDRVNEFLIDEWEKGYIQNQIFWESGNAYSDHFGHAYDSGKFKDPDVKVLWKGEDRLYMNGKYFHADGTLADDNSVFIVKQDTPGSNLDLVYRNSNGKETVIKAGITSPEPERLVFNPSFTACVWLDHSQGKMDIGICQWKLPQKLD